jgi:hypothetical protein
MHRYLLALLLLAAPSVHAQAAPPMPENYRVEEHGGGLGVVLDQTVIFVALADKRWIAERTRRDRNWCMKRPAGGTCEPGDVRSHDWIDSAACPQIVDILRDLSAITPPLFASPDVASYWILSDSSLLTITGRSQSGAPLPGVGGEERLSVTQYGGPYRDWWSKSEKSAGRLLEILRPDGQGQARRTAARRTALNGLFPRRAATLYDPLTPYRAGRS